ncbi:MAG: choice-of-anchor J domain-containing protein, partial [Bacteroidia bacterium]
INNGAIITETFSGLLPPLDSTVYQFSTPEVLPTGTNTIVSWTSLANDELLANDTTSNQVLISNQPTLVAPFTEDFEGQSNCGTSSNCGNEICNLTGGWVNAINFTMDDIDWRVDNGGTPSTATGPSIDHNPGTLSGKYLYTEASSGCEGQLAELYSPCIDVGGMLNPILSFWYHMDGGDMGELHVDILDGNQLYLDVILPLSGDKGPLWLEGQVPLAPYDSLIQIRFRGITGNGFNSDLSIDDISIQDFAQAPMTDFTADKTSTCTGELVSFTDLSTLGPISHNWIITPQVIYTNNTDSTSADPFVIFPVSGFYQVTLITTNAFGSDTTTKVNYIEASDGNPIPFIEDFQAAGFPPADWIVENPDGAFTWEERNVVGATGTPTAAAYVNNFSYNGAGEEDFLVSFPIDLTTAVNPILTFDVAYVRYDAGYEDELRIDLSDDCGDTYNHVVYSKVGTILATAPDQTTSWQPFSSAEWRKDTVDLAGFVGDRITLRFVNITGFGNGLYIDNINVAEAMEVPPTASFTYSGPICLGIPVSFTSNSTGANLFYSWQFGVGATPATSSASGPISVSYSSSGMKTITLIVANATWIGYCESNHFCSASTKRWIYSDLLGVNTAFDFAIPQRNQFPNLGFW